MSQSETNNQKPHILQNQTLKYNRAHKKFRVGAEGSNPIQLCNQNTNKNNKKLRITSTDKKMSSISYYRINVGILPKRRGGARVQYGKHVRKD